MPAHLGVRRWSIRPPQDPVLRSRALTAADHILAAEDIDTAAARFGSLAPAPPRRPRRPARMAGRPHPHDTDPHATRHGRPRTAASPVPSPRPATTAHRLDPTDPASPSPAALVRRTPRRALRLPPRDYRPVRLPLPRQNPPARPLVGRRRARTRLPARTRRTHRPRLLRVDDRVARRRRNRPRRCEP
jgi:hypothetical protein